MITISKESEESDGSDLENDNLNNSTEDLRQKKIAKSQPELVNNSKQLKKIKFSSQKKETVNQLITPRNISKHLPLWGGDIIIKKQDFCDYRYKEFFDYNLLPLNNTCTLDYFLFSLWFSTKDSLKLNDLLSKSSHSILIKIKKIVKLIDIEEWDRAKTVWVLDFMKLKPNELNTFCAFGSLYNSFSKHMMSLQQYKFRCLCRTNDILRTQLTLEKNNKIVSFSFYDFNCKKCLSIGENFFIENPLWLFVEMNGQITIEEVPQNLIIGKVNYSFICAIYHSSNSTNSSLNHFLSIFRFNKKFYFFDDMSNKILSDKIPFKSALEWCVYCLN